MMEYAEYIKAMQEMEAMYDAEYEEYLEVMAQIHKDEHEAYLEWDKEMDAEFEKFLEEN